MSSATARLEEVGRVPVRGTRWTTIPGTHLGHHGIEGDRRWTPARPDLTCPRVTDHPHLVGVAVGADELPAPGEHPWRAGAEGTLDYYGRAMPARLHGGPVADRLSEALGEEVLLARTTGEDAFIWGHPVSLLTRSEIGDLPGDVARYRANLVVDDLESPLTPAPGSRLRVGEVVIELVEPLVRCLVIDRHPVSGRRDAALLGRLGPEVTLGYGCRVLAPGRVAAGDAVEPA